MEERKRPDYCGCPKPEDAWGIAGWHHRPMTVAMARRYASGYAARFGTVYEDELRRLEPDIGRMKIAYERCPRAAVALRKLIDEQRRRKSDGDLIA